MSNQTVSVDAYSLSLAFDELTSKQQKSVFRRAAKDSMKILLTEAQGNIKNATVRKGDPLKYKSMYKGISLMPYKKAVGANVNVLKDHRLKWFESGTKERRTKKGRYTGKIIKTQFFKKANDSKIDEVYTVLEQKISENIVKTFNKKYK